MNVRRHGHVDCFVPYTLPDYIRPVRVVILLYTIRERTCRREINFRGKDPLFVRAGTVNLSTIRRESVTLRKALHFRGRPRRVRPNGDQFTTLGRGVSTTTFLYNYGDLFGRFSYRFVKGRSRVFTNSTIKGVIVGTMPTARVTRTKH